jgi:K+-transporting ATPase ATPase C chain
MLRHFRSHLWLIVLTLLLCSVIYPALLWAVGRAAFPNQANGSLVEFDHKPVGSLLIAQPFTGDEYFQPRPSAASYNGAASSATNWAASNYQLRDRVARTLGPIVKYKSGTKKGQLVGPDIVDWFREADQKKPAGEPGIVARWADEHSTLAQNWVKADPLNIEYVTRWQKEHVADVAAWIKENPGTPEPKPEDLAVIFFKSYAQSFPGTWPQIVEHKTAQGTVEKRIEPMKEGTEIQGVFFDLWRQANPQIDLEEVPADLVMSSGSGLDPHITLKNAHYQLDRVAAAWASKTKSDPQRVTQTIREILDEKKHAPLGGMVGVDLVNVLEVNLAITERMRSLPTQP